MPHLLERLGRTRAKEAAVRLPSSQNHEPDFYAMSAVGLPSPSPRQPLEHQPLKRLASASCEPQLTIVTSHDTAIGYSDGRGPLIQPRTIAFHPAPFDPVAPSSSFLQPSMLYQSALETSSAAMDRDGLHEVGDVAPAQDAAQWAGLAALVQGFIATVDMGGGLGAREMDRDQPLPWTARRSASAGSDSFDSAAEGDMVAFLADIDLRNDDDDEGASSDGGN
jgi:hypothetical protein